MGCNAWIRSSFWRVCNNRPTIPRSRLKKTQKDNRRNIDPEKVTTERLNGYGALFGFIALVGALVTTGQLFLDLFRIIIT